MSKNPDDVYVRIWRGYKTIAKTAYVLRSGFPLIGLTNPLNQSESVSGMFRRRNESILEHSAKVVYLASAMMSHFPGFFGSNKLEFEDYPSELWATITVALLHNVGEIATGDIPDDGNPLHDTKDEIEREFFNGQMAPAYSLEDYSLIRRMFTSFQNHDTPAGQALHCLDKIEAILMLLWLEQYEAYGEITAKPLPTEQDRGFMFLTGTPCATDCWAAHTKTLIDDYPSRITNHIYALLRAAVLDVRGEWFGWWDNV